jgi:hypothetical protein
LDALAIIEFGLAQFSVANEQRNLAHNIWIIILIDDIINARN